MLSRLGVGAFAAARDQVPLLLRNASSFRSSISLQSLYPGSSLKLSTPAFTGDPKEKFSGYIPINKLEVTYSASSGPGGQNVNKLHTKVDLRFKLDNADWIDKDVRVKLAETCKNKLTKEGYLVFKSDLTRSQHLNLADCMQKLRQMIRKAAEPEHTPSPETEERIRRRHEKATRERLMIKRLNSQKRAERRAPTIYDL